MGRTRCFCSTSPMIERALDEDATLSVHLLATAVVAIIIIIIVCALSTTTCVAAMTLW